MELYNEICKFYFTWKDVLRYLLIPIFSVQFMSVTQLCLTICYPMDCSMPGSLPITNSQNLLKLMSIESVMSSNHRILYCPLLLLPSIFPSIRVFSNESGLHHLVVRVSEFQLQHQSFQCIFRTDFL